MHHELVSAIVNLIFVVISVLLVIIVTVVNWSWSMRVIAIVNFVILAPARTIITTIYDGVMSATQDKIVIVIALIFGVIIVICVVIFEFTSPP